MLARSIESEGENHAGPGDRVTLEEGARAQA